MHKLSGSYNNLIRHSKPRVRFGSTPLKKSRTRLSDLTFTFHCYALEKEMTTHSSVLAWRITGTGGLSLGSHRVGHDWSDLAAAAAAATQGMVLWINQRWNVWLQISLGIILLTSTVPFFLQLSVFHPRNTHLADANPPTYCWYLVT